MRIETGLEEFLRQQFPEGTSWTSLKGDASTRRFYRIRPPRAPTRILMAYPDPFLWPQFPLSSVQAHFEAIGVPVPRIDQVFPERGLVLLEDLGDTTLQEALLEDPSLDRARFYREAIDVIVLLQGRGTLELPPDAPSRRIALDEERFLWELQHFYQHFVLGYRGARPTADEEVLFRSFFGWLSTSLDQPDRVLCHRDFQSRNLMVTPAGLRVIDYQDARMGPATYDLASLLKDSSLDLEPSLREEGMRYFLSRRQGVGAEEFREAFERMSLQRNLKDLGTFGYQVHALEHADYERYIPRTLAMVRENLLRHQRYHSVFPLFEKFLFSGSAG